MRVVCVCVCVCGSVCFLLSIEICVPVVFSDSRCFCVFVCVNVCQSVLVLDSLFLFVCRFVIGSFVCEISVCVCACGDCVYAGMFEYVSLCWCASDCDRVFANASVSARL